MLVWGNGGAPGPGVSLERMRNQDKIAMINPLMPISTSTLGRPRMRAFGSDGKLIDLLCYAHRADWRRGGAVLHFGVSRAARVFNLL